MCLVDIGCQAGEHFVICSSRAILKDAGIIDSALRVCSMPNYDSGRSRRCYDGNITAEHEMSGVIAVMTSFLTTISYLVVFHGLCWFQKLEVSTCLFSA